MEDLIEAWAAATDGLTGARADDVDVLLAAWGEPHRRYHDVDHLRAVLARIEWLADREGLAADARRVARLAGWWHDAVYRPAPDDEERSAAWARREIVSWGCPDLADAVAEAVLVTSEHRPRTPAQRALVDADLGILAAPVADYDRYVHRVRAEYAHVDDDAWVSGRAAVLESLLHRDRIFHTGAAAADELVARSNLARELSVLADLRDRTTG